jgi:membrane fusion protein
VNPPSLPAAHSTLRIVPRPTPADAAGQQAIFRAEAVAARAHRLEGEVILAQPPAARVLAPSFAAVLVMVAVFLALASYARTETVSGYVSSSLGVSTLLPPRPGIVQQVFVRTGDRVDAGVVLLEVAAGATLADGKSLESSLREQLTSQRKELEQQTRSARSLLELAEARRTERLAALAQQVRLLGSACALARRRLSVASERANAFEQAASEGVATRDQYQEKLDRVLGLEAELKSLETSLSERAEERRQLEKERETAPVEHDARQSELRLRIAELDARLSDTSSRSSYAINAPIAGTVAVLQAMPGEVVSPERPVAVLIPDGGRLEVSLLVPTRASGFIEPGQAVGIKYAAFPYQEFGIQPGRVLRVETAILSPSELGAPVPVKEPVYRVLVEPSRQAVAAGDRSYALQPGMLLEGEIVLERRRLLSWMLEPVRSLRGTL